MKAEASRYGSMMTPYAWAIWNAARMVARALAIALLDALGYRYSSVEQMTPIVLAACEHHDALSLGLGRLLIWTDPDPIPRDAEAAWEVYRRLWRPGHPRHETWEDAWEWPVAEALP